MDQLRETCHTFILPSLLRGHRTSSRCVPRFHLQLRKDTVEFWSAYAERKT
jgi:hypothetical protein